MLNLNSASQTKFERDQKDKSKSRLWKSAGSSKNKFSKAETQGESEKVKTRKQGSLSAAARLPKSIQTAMTPKLSTEPMETKTQVCANDSSISLDSQEIPNSGKESPYSASDTPTQQEVPLDVETLLKMDLLKEKHCGSRSEKLKMYENVNMGHYERIFPPEDPALLDSYLFLMVKAGVTTYGTETNAVKARREFLLNKKMEADSKMQKFETWKKNRKNLDPHRPPAIPITRKDSFARKVSFNSNLVNSLHELTRPSDFGKALSMPTLRAREFRPREPMPASLPLLGRETKTRIRQEMELSVQNMNASFDALTIERQKARRAVHGGMYGYQDPGSLQKMRSHKNFVPNLSVNSLSFM